MNSLGRVLVRSLIGVLIIRRKDIIHDALIVAEVERRRQAVGYSISELCQRAGISRVAYHRWKRGHGMMPETLGRLRRVLTAAEKRQRRSSPEERSIHVTP
ncbi:MAG: helix-turn-helix transcriptional regulator [Methylobacterium sp.]|nr:helix-turn-helix transcriptional regulator [Cupriavidus sp.]MCA3671909.1 helix-turn-helix transcriptional regulator [Methylobacterium sp.]MCA3676857.1 helix-turn-helix transcriptional regulator [Methylobacterium sp.]MCA3681293.1 helix-turn-helix transcriptional regulator [Methylobacterium sp.]MCA3682603.1 helix-turn-helix transcriptional regulator [Methylobacterium sp.]